MLYFAYGSNLNKIQMQFRCPKAIAHGGGYLTDWQLVFRGVADIEPAEGELLPVGFWEITEDCLAALDRYEGVGSGLYSRVYINGMMTYRMNSIGTSVPPNNYFKSILDGYQDFGLDDSYLHDARHFAMTEEYKYAEYANNG